MEEKKFVITQEQKELLLWNMNNHALMDAKWIIRGLPEFVDQEEIVKKLKEEIKAKEDEINVLLDKILEK